MEGVVWLHSYPLSENASHRVWLLSSTLRLRIWLDYAACRYPCEA